MDLSNAPDLPGSRVLCGCWRVPERSSGTGCRPCRCIHVPRGPAVLVSLLAAPPRAPWLRPTREPGLAPRGFVTEPRGQSSGRGVAGFQPRLLGRVRVGPLRPTPPSLQPRHRPGGSWRYHKARFCWFPALLLLTRALPAVVLANSAATSSLPHGRGLDPGTRDGSLPCAFVWGGSVTRRQRPRLKRFDERLHRAPRACTPSPQKPTQDLSAWSRWGFHARELLGLTPNGAASCPQRPSHVR